MPVIMSKCMLLWFFMDLSVSTSSYLAFFKVFLIFCFCNLLSAFTQLWASGGLRVKEFTLIFASLQFFFKNCFNFETVEQIIPTIFVFVKVSSCQL